MAWDDQPPTAAEVRIPPKDAWDAEPPTREELAGHEDGFLKTAARNLIPDALGLAKGLNDAMGGGTILPEPLALPFEMAKAGKQALSVIKHPRETFDAISEPYVHPIKYAAEHPISQAINALGLLEGGAGLAAKMAPAAATIAESGANALARRGLGFTKRFLNTTGKIENAKEAAQVALDEKVITPGATTEDLLKNAQDLHERSKNEIGDILKEESRGAKRALSPNAPMHYREEFLFKPQEAVKAIEKLRPRSYGGKVLEGGDYSAQNAVIDDAIETIKAHGERPLPWGEANDLKSKLQGLANWDTTKSKTVNSLRKRVGGVFRGSLDSQLQDVMESSGKDIKPFLKAKRLYGASQDMIDGLTNRLSSEMGNKGLGLTDLLSAGVGATIGGAPGSIGGLIIKKIFSAYGLQAGATAAQKIAAVMREAPGVLGKFRPSLIKAARSGTESFNAMHEQLLKNPEYEQIVNKIDEVAASKDASRYATLSKPSN